MDADFKIPFTIIVNSSLRRVRVPDRPKAAMIVEPTGTNQAVTGAIRQAARMTGADFKYLLATAQVESNLNPNAQASTSSARGLFQFTEQTWLTTLKEQGAAARLRALCQRHLAAAVGRLCACPIRGWPTRS